VNAASTIPERTDVVIAGAGPAGMAAAIEARRHGLDVVLVDENADVGGQIYRGIERASDEARKILGPDYVAGAKLTDTFAQCSALGLRNTTIWNVERNSDRGFIVGLSRGGASQTIETRALIIATGALERPFPMPGWTLPGVMTAGAAQTLLKASGLTPDGRVVMAGTGPLLYLLAWQLARAGRPVAHLLDTGPLTNWKAALRHLPDFLASPYMLRGIRLMMGLTGSTRIVRGVTELRADGEERLQSINYRDRRGATHSLTADLLLLHQGVTPHLNLAAACGLALSWDEEQLCFKPETNHFGEGSVAGIFVAGDGGGIAGADAAPWSGRLAAIGTAQRLGRLNAAETDRLAVEFTAARQRFLKGRRFLDALYRPAKSFRVPADDVIVCRCEEVTAARIRKAVAIGATGPNQVKSFERCGMGPCQGRMCGLTVSETIADARGVSPADVGYFRLRAPIKPITMAELAAVPQTETSVAAVIRQ
jgi:NADPH-dependent 2,4-dienoyl-CoA reductase/sulfur reductase-like enzyme